MLIDNRGIIIYNKFKNLLFESIMLLHKIGYPTGIVFAIILFAALLLAFNYYFCYFDTLDFHFKVIKCLLF